MKANEVVILFFLIFILYITYGGIKNEKNKINNKNTFSKLTQPNELLELLFLNIFFDSLVNSIKYYFYNKKNEDKNYCIFCDTKDDCCCICRFTRFIFSIFYIIYEYACCCLISCISKICNFIHNKCNSNKYDKFFIILSSVLAIIFNYFGKIIYTIISLIALFFFYNLIIQSVLIFPGLLIDMENNFFYVIFNITYILFVIFSPYILIIPTYEFITFPYLIYPNPNSHLDSFISKDISHNENDDKINKTMTLFGIFYLIFLLLGTFIGEFQFLKDIYKCVIIIYNLYYYMSIIWCYFFYSLNFLVEIFKYCMEERTFNFFNLNTNFANKINSLPKTDLITFISKSYFKEDDLKIKYSEIKMEETNIQNQEIFYLPKDNSNYNYQMEISHETQIKYNLIICVLKLIMIILSLLALIYLLINFSGELSFFSILFLIIIYFILVVISFWINLPLKYIFSSKKENQLKNKNQIIICFLLSSVIKIIILFLWKKIISKDDTDFQLFNKFENITLNSSETIPNMKNFHSFCKSKIYGIPVHLYMPFINDAYYYDHKRNFTSFNHNNYTKIFFNDDYKISLIKNLTKDNDRKIVKMIQYNVQNKYNKVTILSIQGTSCKRDILLDAQLYLPSVLLNILNIFPNSNRQSEKCTLSLKEYCLNLPYRIFYKFFMIEEYLNGLKSAYSNNDTF